MDPALTEHPTSEDEEVSSALSEDDSDTISDSEVDEPGNVVDGMQVGSFPFGPPQAVSFQGYRVPERIEMDESEKHGNSERSWIEWQQGMSYQTSSHQVPSPQLQPLRPEYLSTTFPESSLYPSFRHQDYPENMAPPNFSGPAYTAAYTTPYRNPASYPPNPNFIPNSSAYTSFEAPQSAHSPSLMWSGRRPSKKTQKLRAVAQLIREDLHMSPVEFLLEIIGCKDEDTEIKEYKSKFYSGNAIPRLLDSISSNDALGRCKLDAWFESRALKLVLDRVDKEMKSLTSEFVIAIKDIKPDHLLNFNVTKDVPRYIELNAPWTYAILLRAAQSDRGKLENKKKNPIPPCTVIAAQLCNLRSSQSILFQAALAYNFFGLGVPKQVMNFLSICGLTVSYTTIHKAHTDLSKKMLQMARPVARQPHVWTCDNIEISTSNHVEQRDLGPPKVISGTTIIIYPAPYALPSVCRLQPIQDRRERCDIISYEDDICPSRDGLHDMRSHLVRQIVNILLDNCKDFQNYSERNNELFSHKIHRAHPKGFRTQQSVLRTIPVSEGSTDGCIEVITNAYVEQLGFGNDDLDGVAIPCINDQATNARIRGAQLIRNEDLSGLLRIELFQLGPGLFHMELNMLWAILLMHRGVSTDIGSLQYYITLLRFTRLNSDHPDFYTLKSFVKRILIAHILQCWENECGFDSLGAYAASNPCPDCLMDLARSILSKYASSPKNRNNDGELKKGVEEDEIFSNFKLLNRDLLYFFELSAAISAGDFGRVELFLGTYLEMFTGAGCKNYSTELLHFIQNLKKVWGTFADVMRDSMIVNLSGRDGHGIGRDMNIEHANNIQKQHLFSKGMHASFETLGDLSPCMPVHSALRRNFADFIGTWQGTHHTNPDVSGHIRTITGKMREEELLKINLSRKADSKTRDVQARGQFILMDRGIKRFSEQYVALVQRGEEFEDEDDEVPEIGLTTDINSDETDSL